MANEDKGSAVTAAVWGKLAKTALLWLIPALLVLPIYLLVLAVSVLASDGSLLEVSGGVRGGINAALGPLLMLCGVAAGVLTVMFAGEAEGYVTGGFFAVVAFGLGVVLMTRELRRMARS